LNVGGGFHHAYPDHGEGFCVLNDFAIGIRRLQKDKAIERAMTVDCDVHQGNGTAAIFAGDHTVFTLSIHQENNYPTPSRPARSILTCVMAWVTMNTFGTGERARPGAQRISA